MKKLFYAVSLLILTLFTSVTAFAAVETVNIIESLAEGDAVRNGRLTDVYQISLKENQSCKVTIQSRDFDGLLQFVRPDQTTDGRTKIEQKAKPVSVEIRARSGEAGVFEVLVSKLKVEAPAQYIIQFTSTEQIVDAILKPDGTLVGGQTLDDAKIKPMSQPPEAITIHGVLEEGDKTFEDGAWLDAYSFEVQAGQEFSGTIQAHDFDGQFIKVNPEGVFSASSKPKKGAASTGLKSRVFKGQGGTYQYIVAAEKPGIGGKYTLTITAPNGGIKGPDGKNIGREGSAPAHPGSGVKPETYTDSQGNEITLSLGEVAFVDESVSNDFGEQRPIESATDPDGAVGRPDFVSEKNTEGFYTMGIKGTCVWKFTDNSVEDGPGPDLLVFEIGIDTEPVGVEISKDGQAWIAVGETAGGRNSIDFAGKVAAGESYFFVRLTDVAGRAGGRWPGADVDAIAAINGKAVSRP